MTNQDDPATTGAQPGRGNVRLDSWKDIAAHLRRDVRTVQRWHRRAGLPVHRHIDGKQRGVFAFQEELDAWANRTRAEAGPVSEITSRLAEPDPSAHRFSRTLLLAAVGLCMVAAIGGWAAFRRGPAQAATFQHRDWLLVAAFEGQGVDDTLQDTLQYALESELAASSFINVVPRARVLDTLRLMRRAEDSRVTPAVAREVSLRDGNIRAVAVGRIGRVGMPYVLTVELVDPHTGATIATCSDQVVSESELLGALRRLALSVRDALGERRAMPAQDANLPRVTTASLTALRLYGKAEEAQARHQRQAARVLLESAVREDPQFASAYRRLALVMASQPDSPALRSVMVQHAERALALADRVTEAERLRIVATYHTIRAEYEKATAACEALTKLDPDDWEAHSALASLYYRLSRNREAVNEVERAANLRPNDFGSVVWAAQAWAITANDVDHARPYVERARALLPAHADRVSGELGVVNLPPPQARQVAWVLFFRAYELWRASDVPAMVSEVQQALASNLPADGPERDAFLTIAISLYMSAGRLSEAGQLAERMFQERLRHLHLAVIADAVDDFQALRRHMSRVPVQGEERALRYVRAGLDRQAEEVLSRPGFIEGFAHAARGELALRRGRHAEAIEELRRGIELTRTYMLAERYLAAESLADVLERLNRTDEALAVLEAAAADVPQYARTGPSGAFWLRVLGRLSQTYRRMGRISDADVVDRRLQALLALGDASHPLVRQVAQNRNPAGDRALLDAPVTR